MSKYAPLWQYVKQNEPASLSFDEVEQILGFAVDHSFLSFKKELAAYGWQVGKISIKKQTINFTKTEINND